jgi:hypothetical protein
METLRLASSYQFKAYVVPTPENPSPGGGANNNPIGDIPAYSQVEQQLSIDPGSYLYGWLLAVITAGGANSNFHIQVTDACTETPIFSDYALGSLFSASPTGIQRAPFLLSQPRLISDPGLVNVEIYNNSSSTQAVQLVLFTAAPRPGPQPYAFDGNPGFHHNGKRGPNY